jgi:hypothetical protein
MNFHTFPANLIVHAWKLSASKFKLEDALCLMSAAYPANLQFTSMYETVSFILKPSKRHIVLIRDAHIQNKC